MIWLTWVKVISHLLRGKGGFEKYENGKVSSKQIWKFFFRYEKKPLKEFALDSRLKKCKKNVFLYLYTRRVHFPICVYETFTFSYLQKPPCPYSIYAVTGPSRFHIRPTTQLLHLPEIFTLPKKLFEFSADHQRSLTCQSTSTTSAALPKEMLSRIDSF